MDFVIVVDVFTNVFVLRNFSLTNADSCIFNTSIGSRGVFVAISNARSNS